MIKAHHNSIIYSFFKIYTALKIKKNFNAVRIIGNIDVSDHSVLLIANHVSWWDGFWVLHLCMNKLNKKFHFMMLEKELRKRWIFSYSGGFSIAKGAKSMIESLNYSIDLLKDTNNLVLMFPQGKLQSLYQDEFKFQKGVERIIEKSRGTKVVFMASLIDYFEHPLPDLYLYLQEYNSENSTIAEIEKSYRNFFKSCVENQKLIEI